MSKKKENENKLGAKPKTEQEQLRLSKRMREMAKKGNSNQFTRMLAMNKNPEEKKDKPGKE